MEDTGFFCADRFSCPMRWSPWLLLDVCTYIRDGTLSSNNNISWNRRRRGRPGRYVELQGLVSMKWNGETDCFLNRNKHIAGVGVVK